MITAVARNNTDRYRRLYHYEDLAAEPRNVYTLTLPSWSALSGTTVPCIVSAQP